MVIRLYPFVTHVRRLSVDVALSGAAFCTVTVLPLLNSVGVGRIFHSNGLIRHVGIYLLVSAAMLSICRVYRMIWKYVSFRDILTLVLAATLTVLGFLSLELILLNKGVAMPRTLVALAISFIWTANVGFLAVPRLMARALNDSRIWHVRDHEPIPVLLTGDAKRMDAFIRECEADQNRRHRVVGVLIEDGRLHGSYLHGVKVLGSVGHLRAILARLKERGIRAHTLVVADDSATRADFQHFLELAASTELKVGRLPRLGTFQSSSHILPIELADLLGRPEIAVDAGAVAAMVKGKRVLVTGAGGSIGSELSRQIARLMPSTIVVLDSSEFNLYTIDKELEETHPALNRKLALVDVRDTQLVNHWIEATKPEIVFHAAALKHVPLLEDHPIEGIKTNVLGTINIAEACCANGVSAMVTISTDKAVNPCNVMGATKRLAEAYCQGLDGAADQPSATRFITVRFGNVLGSAGSVVPLFQRQIEAGGPITVTHPDIRRYFMTIPEAVTLVLQAGAQGIDIEKERGNIYVLDMGEPVKIVDLARQMIRLSGCRPDIDIKIEIIGLRPGEKLSEEIAHREEAVVATCSKSVLKLMPRITDIRITRHQVQELRQACLSGDRFRALRVLHLSVPEYVTDQSTPTRAAIS